MCCGVDEALSGEDKLRSLVDFSKDSIKNILKKSLRIYASSACYDYQEVGIILVIPTFQLSRPL